MICLAVFLTATATAVAAVRGIAPGNFFYSLHQPVPLVNEPKVKTRAEFEKLVNPTALFGAPAERTAGAHPDLSVGMVIRNGTLGETFEGLNTPTKTTIELPPGVLANLGNVPVCPLPAFERTLVAVGSSPPGAPERCPAESQIGVVGALFGASLSARTYPLYKIEAPPGHLAALGFPYEILFERVPMVITVDPRTDGDYGLDLTRETVPNFNNFLPAPFMTIWGTPGDPIHNAERINPKTWTWGAPLPAPHPPLIGSLAGCGAGTSEMRLRLLYSDAAGRLEFPESSEDPRYRAFAPEQASCESLSFAPGLDIAPTSGDTDAASGLKVRLHLPQATDATEPATPPLREAILTLPAGMSLNSAVASGLDGCPPGPEACPPASKLGTVTVKTPMAEGLLHGAVYLAMPFENPFRSRWALYLVLNGLGSPIKLPAEVGLESGSRRLVITLDSLPPLPVEDVTIKFPDIPVGPLSTPAACGTQLAQARLTPWSGPSKTVESEFRFEPAGAVEGCEATTPKPFSPQLSAALDRNDAAARSSLQLEVRRPAGDQGLKSVAASLPHGLVASLRYRSLCGEAEIATAIERSVPGGGVVERVQASCPGASRVGSLTVASGTGLPPLLSAGSLYLAGPYKGAPYSLVAITPALAGGNAGAPLFDLGTVVSRAALRIDPRTAQITIESDPLPQSLDGVPLRIGTLRFDFDASDFLHNPSGCAEKWVSATVEGREGARADLVAGLWLTGCRKLRFRPTISLRSLGANGVGAHPRLTLTFAAPRGNAGIAAARLTLPSSIGLDRDRLANSCEPPERAWASCPSSSIVGKAVAWTSLADQPLEGPVRLVSSPNDLPTLAISLGGRFPLELVGVIRSRGGSVGLDFAGLPDVSLARLAISIGRGGKSFFVNRRGLCARLGPVEGQFTAYNDKVARRTSALRADC